ncbi:heterokaryon incompatibility protein-domain-containing protein [Podospora appendiculata]|uniref:Heterokaryon incompatibility protein-domain-containing protein n=1 Tax=Podospora appendiculata TaxID=314037 RepID=A0AAE0WYZ5_9PEZI|nr:heterokaryon incompatibility protein-domain-containing protein [Podospora appendiculata]
MSAFTYSPLRFDDEFRVFVLDPAEDRNSQITGSILHGRISILEPLNVPVWTVDYIVAKKSIKTVVHNQAGKPMVINKTLKHWFYNYTRTKYSAAEFDALSYAWGNSAPVGDISIGGQSFPVAANLLHALHRLRLDYSHRVLWIDGLCINQTDLAERNHQVKMMKLIYSHAAAVIVWLGDPVDSASVSDAYRMIHSLNNPEDINASGGILGYSKSALRGAVELFRRPWWKRIWIIQEVVSARQLVIGLGVAEKILPWTMLRKLCSSIRDVEFSQHPKAKLLRGCEFPKFITLDQFRTKYQQLQIPTSPSQQADFNTLPLDTLLQLTQDYQATDPRDTVYAILGVASDIQGDEFFADYTKPLKRVCFDLFKFMVSTKSRLGVISSGSYSISSALGAPSWLPNLGKSQMIIQPLFSPADLNATLYRASGDSLATVDISDFPSLIEARGIFVDKVDTLGGKIQHAHESLPALQRWEYLGRVYGQGQSATPEAF